LVDSAGTKLKAEILNADLELVSYESCIISPFTGDGNVHLGYIAQIEPVSPSPAAIVTHSLYSSIGD
jgi:hypothetical protein